MSGNHGNSSAISTVNTSLPDTEDDQTIAQVLAEEHKLSSSGNGNQLAKRLSHLDSIPHTPRVIGDIPDPGDATLDHDRLAERLITYGLAELQIEGDGNCQFRALADQLFHNPDYHRHVRKEVVKQLKNCKQLYEGYVPMKYRDYLNKMKRAGEWGDHVTLQAAADRFGAKICLVTSFRDTCYIEILPFDKKFSRGMYERLLYLSYSPEASQVHDFPWSYLQCAKIWLSFWSEVHYNSLYDTGDVPTRIPRKKLWLF